MRFKKLEQYDPFFLPFEKHISICRLYDQDCSIPLWKRTILFKNAVAAVNVEMFAMDVGGATSAKHSFLNVELSNEGVKAIDTIYSYGSKNLEKKD